MFADEKWVLFVIFLVGILAGFLICKGLYERRRVGTLRIDRSDPTEPPYFFLEVTNLRRIEDGKLVSMRVRAENYIPQK